MSNDESLLVMLVDDDPSVRDVLTRLLKQQGHRVEAFEQSEAAAERFGMDSSFDLLITDVLMPGVSGVELARTLRRRAPNLPVLMCSGLSRRGGQSAATLDPPVAFISKPILPDALLEAMRDLMAASEHEQNKAQ